jgi:hypothetical protein
VAISGLDLEASQDAYLSRAFWGIGSDDGTLYTRGWPTQVRCDALHPGEIPTQ